MWNGTCAPLGTHVSRLAHTAAPKMSADGARPAR